MGRNNVMTINERLIEKFKHKDLKENLANGILIAVRPNVVLKEQITEEVRTKIVSLFSSREDKLKIDNRNVGGLINWENMEEQDLVPMPTNHKIHVNLIQAFGDDDYWDYSYPWQDVGGAQLGKVVGSACVLQNQGKHVVKASCAHVSDLTPAGWQRLVDWLQSEGLKVTLIRGPKGGEVIICMNTTDLSSDDGKKG